MTIAARHIDITTEEIVCSNGMPAFLAYPTGGGKFPTVAIMHERYGLVKHTKDQAMRCARDGFAVLAPNFFFRHPDQKVLMQVDGHIYLGRESCPDKVVSKQEGPNHFVEEVERLLTAS